MSPSHDISHPDRFTVGTVGPLGARTFLLQARQGEVLVTLKVEKQQVAVLAGYLARIVREQARPGHLPEDLELEEAAEPEWVVGTIGVSFDDGVDRLVVIAEELVPGAEGDEEDEDRLPAGDVVRFAITREQAAAFAVRATKLVASGRPPCPLCGYPLDPSGHECPRTNGHRPPKT